MKLINEKLDQHPIDQIAYWDSTPNEIACAKDLYDSLVSANPGTASKLNALLDWAMEQASFDEAYNYGEG